MRFSVGTAPITSSTQAAFAKTRKVRVRKHTFDNFIRPIGHAQHSIHTQSIHR
jgi:hypothetical protein